MPGVALALVALFGWGIADFLSQKAARKAGIAGTLFFGSLFGFVILFPFARGGFDALAAHPQSFVILGISVVVGLFAALFSLEAYRRGKLAVVEPIMGLELPCTILLAVLLRGETLGVKESLVMIAAFIGIVMTASSQPLGEHFSKKTLEKGALLGLIGAVALGASNFTIGVASQDTSPIMTVWFGRAALAVILGVWLIASRRLGAAFVVFKQNLALMLTVSTLYLAAFVSYGMATTLIPISVATTISESYIVLTTLLGVFVNREKLTTHQFVGVGIVIASVLALAGLTA